MKRWFAVAMALGMSGAAIGAPESSPALVVKAFTKAGASEPALAQKVEAARKRVALILVPGIMGSRLRSPSQGVIWGDGGGFPSASQLALPPALIDEKAPSDVEATLLESYVVDQYGKAFASMREAATKAGIQAYACGYDWRRDLRAGAADVEKCVQKSVGTDPHTPIIVAHSMGGVVTSIWNEAHEAGRYSPQHLVGGIAYLGSPLAGSCEIVRMVQTGYVQPTESLLNAGKKFAYVYEKVDLLLGSGQNQLTSFLSGGVRTAMLSWPGAFELAPKPTTKDTDGRPCVPARPIPDDGGSTLLSYFDPPFWSTTTGKELLNGATPPAHFPQVIAKAKEFKEWYAFKRPEAPMYAYFSRYWKTPEKAMLGPNGNFPANDGWTLVEGDGRVPMPDGGARPSEDWLSESGVVYSVHGSLPRDTQFQDWFLRDRLPGLVSTLVAYRLLAQFTGDAAVIKSYVKAGGPVPNPAEFIAGMDAPAKPATGNQVLEARSALGRKITQAVVQFGQGICSASPQACAPTYASVKKVAYAHQEAVKTYSSVLAGGAPKLDKAAAAAQIGLAHVHLGNVAAAGVTLSQASAELGAGLATETMTAQGKTQLNALKVVVDRNLAISLRRSGQCTAAKDVLLKLQDATTQYAADLNEKCFDRDTGIYQVLSDF